MATRQQQFEAVFATLGQSHRGSFVRGVPLEFQNSPRDSIGSAGGGRYNAAATLRMLYLGENTDTVARETRLIVQDKDGNDVAHPQAPTIIMTVEYELQRVTDLTDPKMLELLVVKASSLVTEWTEDSQSRQGPAHPSSWRSCTRCRPRRSHRSLDAPPRPCQYRSHRGELIRRQLHPNSQPCWLRARSHDAHRWHKINGMRSRGNRQNPEPPIRVEIVGRSIAPTNVCEAGRFAAASRRGPVRRHRRRAAKTSFPCRNCRTLPHTSALSKRASSVSRSST